MQQFEKRLKTLIEQIEAAFSKLDIPNKQAEITALNNELARPEIWNNPSDAQRKNIKLSELSAIVEPWQTIKFQAYDLLELIKIADDELTKELAEQISAIENEFEVLRKDLRFNGEFDDHGAIIRLSAGVGGTDAQDWTEMIERMYLRWADRSGMKADIIERSIGEEAGIKSSVIEISGYNAYGKLRSEHGVHRLVRLSPFNSDNLRQTSFALVEVLPKIDKPEEVMIDDNDIKIDVYRAGGHGGQSVNTTDSAVRITHAPTGIVVAIQNERSQLQNRETAMKILRSKLTQLKLEQHAASVSELRAGESANWGSQIRNYVLHPYTMVKDTRTKYEERDVASVLDGKIDGFIEAFLDK